MLYCRRMSGLESDGLLFPPPPAPAAPRPFFRPWVTWLNTVFVLLITGYLLHVGGGGPLEHLRSPEDSLERLTEREMDARAALARATPLERRLYAALSSGDEGLEDWIHWHDELAQSVDSPEVELERFILLGEAKQTDALREGLERWERSGDEVARMKEWLVAAYLVTAIDRSTARTLMAEVRDTLPAGWFADSLVARIAQRAGDAVSRAQAESAMVARGTALLRRWRVLEAGGLVLVLAGLAGLTAMLVTRVDLRIANARMPEDFSFLEGYGLFIRGALGFLVAGLALGIAIPPDSGFEVVSGPATAAPIVLLTLWYVRSRGLALAEALGLRPATHGLPRLAWVSLTLVGVAIAGEAAASFALDALHLSAHWADGLQENLIWGSWGMVARETVDSVFWAPLAEEIGFRGVLYPALRTRWGAGAAAAMSAAVFAAAHGYGVAGFAAVFWSGILWAWTYERTGSILPSLAAHAFSNAAATATVVVLLRL